MKTMRIKNAAKLTDQKWLNLFDVAFLDHDGKERNWQLASRRNQPKCVTGRFTPPDAVVIVPYHTQENKIVITREYRIALADYEYGFPAGLVDEGETAEEAARRELSEETGLTAARILKVGPPVYSSAGMTDESVSMVYLECRGQPSAADNRGVERIEVILASARHVARLLASPALKFDAKAWLVLSAYAELGRL